MRGDEPFELSKVDNKLHDPIDNRTNAHMRAENVRPERFAEGGWVVCT